MLASVLGVYYNSIQLSYNCSRGRLCRRSSDRRHSLHPGSRRTLPSESATASSSHLPSSSSSLLTRRRSIHHNARDSTVREFAFGVLKQLPAWLLGAAIITPMIAILQGSVLLIDYRYTHGDAPYPEVPSRGVLMMQADTEPEDRPSLSLPQECPYLAVQATIQALWSKWLQRPHRRTPQLQNRNETPLRLLVIGDSLAAGVGTTQSSTPILPEAIAQALSQALQGRAVYWTCVGTPGLTSSQVMEEIYRLPTSRSHRTNPSDPNNEATNRSPTAITTLTPPALDRLAQRLIEWQAQSRQRTQARWETIQRRTRVWWDNRDPAEKGSSSDQTRRETSTDSQLPQSNETNDSPSKNPLLQWWKKQRQRFQQNVRAIQYILESEPEPEEDLYNGGEDDIPDHESRTSSDRQVTQRIFSPQVTRRASMVRQILLDAESVGQYDVAVVLTGLNDIKDTFLPFLMSRERLEGLQEARKQAKLDGFTGELIGILHALKERMEFLLPGDPVDPPVSSMPPQIRENMPLVVFPAMPIAPIKISQIVPLCWFLVPLIRLMDRNKHLVAEMYPGVVIYVESPDPSYFSEARTKRGPLWATFNQERVLFKLTDIAHAARDRIEDLMKKHYQAWMFQNAEGEAEDTYYELDLDGVSVASYRTYYQGHRHHLVAFDGIHPNDAGYEAWGRYIAYAIVNEWQRRQADHQH